MSHELVSNLSPLSRSIYNFLTSMHSPDNSNIVFYEPPKDRYSGNLFGSVEDRINHIIYLYMIDGNRECFLVQPDGLEVIEGNLLAKCLHIYFSNPEGYDNSPRNILSKIYG